MLKNNKNYKGFTFIEVMVAIAIVAIMVVVSTKTWLNNKRQAEVESAASEIVSLINQTRNSALTGKKVDSGPDLGIVPTCYSIFFNDPSNSGKYQRYYYKDETCSSFIFLSDSIVSDKIKLEFNAANQYFRYGIPDGERIDNGLGSTNIKVILKQDESVYKEIEVSKYRAFVK